MTVVLPGPAHAGPIRTLRAQDVAPQPWRNGGGLTRELLAWPAPGEGSRVRVALADIAADGPFSAFPGITRWFAPVQGGPVTLALAEGPRTLRAGDAPLRFDGGLAPLCTLAPDRPARALNLMLQGASGALLAARAGEPGPEPWPWRCLFAVQAGDLCGDRHAPLRLDAFTLAGPLPEGEWRFVPAAAHDTASAAPPCPGFWLVADLEATAP